MEEKKIEVNYYILNGIGGVFNSINITAKPDMTISNIFDKVRQKYKNYNNIIKIELLDIEKIIEKL